MFPEALAFNDVLIRSCYSTIRSRSEVDLSVALSKELQFKLPMFPSSMKTVMNLEVAEEMYKLGGLSLFHRFEPFGEQLAKVLTMRERHPDFARFFGVSVGIKEEDYANLEVFYQAGVRIVCMDIAHAHSVTAMEFVQYVKKNYPDVFLIAGAIATGAAAVDLWNAGADMVRVNQGNGSICSTRIMTGIGMPQLSALMDIYEARQCNQFKEQKFILADGGCANVGDMVKSLVFADMVMSGNMFAGSLESPGDVIDVDGRKCKRYDGSSTHKTDHIEGVKAFVHVKGSIQEIVKTMTDGISSGCSYVGARNLKELREKAKFVRITNAGMVESGAHDLVRVMR